MLHLKQSQGDNVQILVTNIVKQIRLQGLTQEQLAKETGVGLTPISHLETGVGAALRFL